MITRIVGAGHSVVMTAHAGIDLEAGGCLAQIPDRNLQVHALTRGHETDLRCTAAQVLCPGCRTARKVAK